MWRSLVQAISIVLAFSLAIPAGAAISPIRHIQPLGGVRNTAATVCPQKVQTYPVYRSNTAPRWIPNTASRWTPKYSQIVPRATPAGRNASRPTMRQTWQRNTLDLCGAGGSPPPPGAGIDTDAASDGSSATEQWDGALTTPIYHNANYSNGSQMANGNGTALISADGSYQDALTTNIPSLGGAVTYSLQIPASYVAGDTITSNDITMTAFSPTSSRATWAANGVSYQVDVQYDSVALRETISITDSLGEQYSTVVGVGSSTTASLDAPTIAYEDPLRLSDGLLVEPQTVASMDCNDVKDAALRAGGVASIMSGIARIPGPQAVPIGIGAGIASVVAGSFGLYYSHRCVRHR